MFIPDPDLDFLPIPDPGVKKAPDPGSGSATLDARSQNIIQNRGLIGKCRTVKTRGERGRWGNTRKN
jgi:hypothetical protein